MIGFISVSPCPRLLPGAFLFYTHMAQYRPVPTITWVDDTLLSMSPEQKLIFLYLHTCPASTQCGIYKLPLKTMGFHLGYTQSPVESALIGLCAAFPDFVAYDRTCGEVALLQYPKHILTNANNKVLNVAASELSEIQSIELLKAMIAQNSATINQMYRSRLRQIQMLKINADRAKNENELLDGDLLKGIENQQDAPKRESKVNIKESKVKEKEEPPPLIIESFNYISETKPFDAEPTIEKSEKRYLEASQKIKNYFAQFPDDMIIICDLAKKKLSPARFVEELDKWLSRNVENLTLIQNPVARLKFGESSFKSWIEKPWVSENQEQKSNGYANANRNTETANERITRVAGGAIEFHNELLAKHGLL